MNPYQEIHSQCAPPPSRDAWNNVDWDAYFHKENLARKQRDRLINVYGWAIPNDEAIQAIAALGPIVEIGAGTGYWSSLLAQAGADVQAFDLRTVGRYPKNYGQLQQAHYPVSRGGWQRALRMYPARTVLMVWPCYDKPWSGEVVKATRAEFVVHVGEDCGGCTGSQEMHWLLSGEDYWWGDDDDPQPEYRKREPLFELWDTVDIPQWPGLHDHVQIYQRVARPT